MAVEPTDLAVGAIGDPIAVDAGLQQHVLAADVNAQESGAALDPVVVRLAVARHRDQIEAVLAHPSVGILEGVWEVAVDAAPDLLPLRIDPNRLGDRQIAVAVDCDVALEQQDLFGRARRSGKGVEDEKGDERTADPGANAAAQVNLTSGSWRSAASSSSKYCALSKPNCRATRLDGKLSTFVFSSRTEPL